MKFLLFILFIAAVLSVIYVIKGSNQKTQNNLPAQTQKTQSPTPAVSEFHVITVDEKQYAYERIGPIHPKQVTLHSNLPKKESAASIKQQQNCKQLTSAGFYTTTNNPIGLFVIDDVVYAQKTNNSLFIGYIWKTKKDKAGIGAALHNEALAFALQSGPLLLHDSKPLPVSLATDEQARRIAAAVTKNGSVIFLAVFAKENTYNGPLLENVAKIISEINKKEDLNIVSAINLDGGNHSAFLSEEISLHELSPVGSVFCMK